MEVIYTMEKTKGEILAEEGIISFSEGKLLLIESRD